LSTAAEPSTYGYRRQNRQDITASWDAFADVEAFVDEVLVELAAMEADGTKPTRSGPKPALCSASI
jgi:hypothetical protein